MIEQILDYLHNYFEKEIVQGSFTISGGTIDLDFLKVGQYFRIRGSVLNDGVYRYPVYGLPDEEFTGEIWAMAVPPSVVALSQEIEEWQSKYGGVDSALMSPYQSESFGGYSYNKSGGGSGDGTSLAGTWQGAFGPRLNRWRKI